LRNIDVVGERLASRDQSRSVVSCPGSGGDLFNCAAALLSHAASMRRPLVVKRRGALFRSCSPFVMGQASCSRQRFVAGLPFALFLSHFPGLGACRGP
jgi:hypothetical protein